MSKVIFNYENNITEIQCNQEDQMKRIIQKFKQKIGIDTKELFFSYNGTIINEEFKLSQIQNSIDKERKILNILVFNKEFTGIKEKIERSKDIICPKCRNNARIDIKNFNFSLYGCINNHNINNLSINEFKQSQNIDISKIICDICKKKNKAEAINQKFYYCLFCQSNLCILCNSIHNQEHKIVQYDKKNYFCLKHFSNYIKYCKQCNKNMCIQCEKEHKTHETIFFGDIIIERENYIKEMNKLKDIFAQLQKEINSLINLLINFSENIKSNNKYFKI